MNLAKIGFLFIMASLLFLLSSCTSTGKNDTAIFHFNLKKGKVYDYNMDFDMEQEMQGQKVNTKMESEYSIEVTDDDGNLKTLKATYERIALNVSLPGRNIQADSDKIDTVNKEAVNEPGHLMNAMFGALKGKSFFVKVDKEGKVTEVNGMNEIAQSMISGLNIKEELKPMAQQAFSQQFNEQNIKDMFSQSFNIFPNKPVKIGDTWEKKVNGSAAMPINMTTVYKVQSIDGNMVTLNTNSKMDFTGDSKMSGNQTGIMKVDASSGLVTKGNFEQKITGQMNMITKGKVTGKVR
jgi:hypothetical protein